MITSLVVNELYSNEEIFKSLLVSNAGGIRLSLVDEMVLRAVIMTSVQGLHGAGENPYHDRLEGDILTYTAAGKVGEQSITGANYRITEQKGANFPIHGFVLIASRRDKSVGPKRWRYLGLLEYLRHYPDTQLDAKGTVRRVWLFEFKIHQESPVISLSDDCQIAAEMLVGSRQQSATTSEDDEIIEGTADGEQLSRIEHIRGQLLSMAPKSFEVFLEHLLVHCGFNDVCVTKFTADGGVDVNARVGERIWVIERLLVQVQAKRWLHSVGRKEVAELRGSLQPFAMGALVTTSHFSRAAIKEASEGGKNPITLVDGLRLARVVLEEQFPLANFTIAAAIRHGREGESDEK